MERGFLSAALVLFVMSIAASFSDLPAATIVLLIGGWTAFALHLHERP